MASSHVPIRSKNQSTKSQGTILSMTNAAYGLDLRAIQRNCTSHSTGPADSTADVGRRAGPQSQFPFLFQRSSDEIGKGVAPPASTPSRAGTAATAPAFALPVLQQDNHDDDNPEQQHTKDSDFNNGGGRSVTHIHAEKYLQAYHHQTKAENPLYRTSQSVIGARPPSMATVVTERHSIPQAFSSSFGNILYSDQSLNTRLSRSKVHRALDPHFY